MFIDGTVNCVSEWSVEKTSPVMAGSMIFNQPPLAVGFEAESMPDYLTIL